MSYLETASYTKDETLSSLAVMCLQEERSYARCDCFQQQKQYRSIDVDADCRAQMIDWCYGVVDFCNFSHVSVEVSISYLDRFLCTQAGIKALSDRWVFQLASMTALYTAVKINEGQAMDPKLVATMSRGMYSPEDVEAMESLILNALGWRMNPPTTAAFVHLLLRLIPESTLSMDLQDYASKIATLQTEIAVKDYSFAAIKASTIAYCAVMNALESLGALSHESLGYLGYFLAQAIGINNSNDPMIVSVQTRLYEIVVPKMQHSPKQTGITKRCCVSNATQDGNMNLAADCSSFDESPRVIS